jgi:butyrate kinase
MVHTILVINPGSTSTKVAIFENSREADVRTLVHAQEEIDGCETIAAQLAFRKEAVCNYLNERGVPLEALSAIAARGGVVGRLEAGLIGSTRRWRKLPGSLPARMRPTSLR